MHREVLTESKARHSKLYRELPKRSRIPGTWENLEATFLIYVGVIVQVYPERSLALFKYMDIIRQTNNMFKDMSWFNYGKQFQFRTATQTGIQWDIPHHRLWLEWMTPRGPEVHTDSDLFIPQAA